MPGPDILFICDPEDARYFRLIGYKEILSLTFVLNIMILKINNNKYS